MRHLTADFLGPILVQAEIKGLIFPPCYRLWRFHLSLWLQDSFHQSCFISWLSCETPLLITDSMKWGASFCPVSKPRSISTLLSSSLRVSPTWSLTWRLIVRLSVKLQLSVTKVKHLQAASGIFGEGHMNRSSCTFISQPRFSLTTPSIHPPHWLNAYSTPRPRPQLCFCQWACVSLTMKRTHLPTPPYPVQLPERL